MSEDPFALKISPPSPLTEAEYERIRATLAETERGRWFLHEYARRSRAAEIEAGLAALQRMQRAILGDAPIQSTNQFRDQMVEMALAITRTKAEIAAIKPRPESRGKIEDATGELDSIVQTTESATSRILAAAEQMQEIAWTLRERDISIDLCNQLDGLATEIYTACAFQDLTGQRTRKVIQVLRYLEHRINAMIEIWGKDVPPAPVPDLKAEPDALTNGPSPPGIALAQADVDAMLEPPQAAEGRRDASIQDIGRVMLALEPSLAEPQNPDQPIPEADLNSPPAQAQVRTADAAGAKNPKPAANQAMPASPSDDAKSDDFLFGSDASPGFRAAMADGTASGEKTEPAEFLLQPEPVSTPTSTEPAIAAAKPDAKASPQSDPLATLRALSDEEKIALFS